MNTIDLYERRNLHRNRIAHMIHEHGANCRARCGLALLQFHVNVALMLQKMPRHG